MIKTEKLLDTLVSCGISFFAGVPDSLLKSFCAYVTDTCSDNHVIAANEGGAVGLATGHYLATGNPALVYMQNSGQGNAVNPLASLADPDVYSIPMILLVGWRGQPGVKDEPQHVKQGKVTISLFETLGIPTEVLPDDETTALALVEKMVTLAKTESRPVALVARKGTFAEYRLQNKAADISTLKREDAIQAILESIGSEAVVVSTTGMISREVYETRERLGQDHSRDFLTVGSMGHALMIALGIARDCNKHDPNRYVVCLDGDGASIMHMGNMAVAGAARQPNLLHFVLNNSAHDSVGGQPTVGGKINLSEIAKSCGYYVAATFDGDSIDDLRALLRERIDQALYSWAVDATDDLQTVFFEIKVAKGARKDLGRPKELPQVNKSLYMKTLGVEQWNNG